MHCKSTPMKNLQKKKLSMQGFAGILSPHQFFCTTNSYSSIILLSVTTHLHPQVATHCSVTNHVPTPLNAAPTITNAHLSKKCSLPNASTSCNSKKIPQPCQIFHLPEKKKQNPPTGPNFPLAKQYNKKGRKSIRYKHNLFCHKQKINHHNHDNSTSASNVITSKQVSSAPWNSRKQQRNGSGMALNGRPAHILQANFFFATIFFFWNFRHQLAIDTSTINEPSPPPTRSRKSIIFLVKGNRRVSQSRGWNKNDNSTCNTSCIQYLHASNELAVVKETFLSNPSNIIFPSRRDSQ